MGVSLPIYGGYSATGDWFVVGRRFPRFHAFSDAIGEWWREESRGDVWRITMWSMSLHAYVDVCC